MKLIKKHGWFIDSITNSYSQVFFSNHLAFAGLLFLATFLDLYTGLFGLLSVMITNLSAVFIGFDKNKIRLGYYGFNSLLVGLGLGVYFEPGIQLLLIIILSAFLCLFISVAFEGVIGKYALPYLSLPFVFTYWIVFLATREFSFLYLNERGIYILNDLYSWGGQKLVDLYNWWNSISFPKSLKTYFSSLSAIFFQHSTLTGILIATGLLINSRIAFILSLLGFYTAYLFYTIIGVEFSEISYSFIGFNYILTAIAIGGYFIIPSCLSFFWVLVLIPISTLFTFSAATFLNLLYLPVYSLPFNLVTLLFLYVLKFRTKSSNHLTPVVIQEHSPEKNLYSYKNFMKRFGKENPIPVFLPFYGEWYVSQGIHGKYTHQGDWAYAYDFEITDAENKTYKNEGHVHDDYYCYNKNVLSPADGTVEEVVDDIPDNPIGEKNLKQNWGNTVIIKHSEFLYSQLSHLKQSSIIVKPGEKVKKGDIIGKCGNSGNSPYPHLHFQLQSTPYLGSKTLEYPINNYILNKNGNLSLQKAGFLSESDKVSNVIPHPLLKNAFNFVVGEKFQFKIDNEKEEIVKWEVKMDYYLNKYIECEKTGSKAWFRTDESMLYFTYFQGNRKSLLYNFYLAAYTLCFGYINNLSIKDSFPLNMVFKTMPLIIQDFIAPFADVYSADFHLYYPASGNVLTDNELTLKSEIKLFVPGSKKTIWKNSFQIDKNGLKNMSFQNNKKIIHAQCIKE